MGRVDEWDTAANDWGSYSQHVVLDIDGEVYIEYIDYPENKRVPLKKGDVVSSLAVRSDILRPVGEVDVVWIDSNLSAKPVRIVGNEITGKLLYIMDDGTCRMYYRHSIKNCSEKIHFYFGFNRSRMSDKEILSLEEGNWANTDMYHEDGHICVAHSRSRF